MAISETMELLGKGLYDGIPDVLTLKSIPTASELDAVGSEDFDKIMLEKILPEAVEEDVDFSKLLEIDFQWLCRCLRIINYGPYHTTNVIFCDKCGKSSYGEYLVDLQTIPCKPLPEHFINDMVIKKDEFIDFDNDIHIKLPTIRDILNANKDKAFQDAEGKQNKEFARMCYMISAIGDKNTLTPPQIKMILQDQMTSADYMLLSGRVKELSNYGLRAGGKAQCPNCGNKNAGFIALVDDRFFRPSMGALRKWRDSGAQRKIDNIFTGETSDV